MFPVFQMMFQICYVEQYPELDLIKGLYIQTDADFIYKFRRGIGVNGINLATTRADFLDRSLIIKLKRIEPKARRKKVDVDIAFKSYDHLF